jgi:spore coat protein H
MRGALAYNRPHEVTRMARAFRIYRGICFALLAAIAAARAVSAATPTTRPAGAFLDPAALHTIHLKLTPDAWTAMQPTRKGAFSGLFAATRPSESEPKHESPFGYQYVYVRAALECDGATYPEVGLRYKGNSSYMLGPGVKKPFKIDVNRFDEHALLGGLTGFNLHNNAIDPTLMREPLSYAVFREAGVVAPRTSIALVYLTVDKLHDRKLAGLYTIVEEVDKAFLKDRFGSAKGLLLKPENCFNLPYLGEDFARYQQLYRPKTDATPRTSARLVEFLKLIHYADDATFERAIAAHLDVDGFLRFLAANVLLANMDSILSTGHNFYIYVHPDTLKVHFIPWDLNLSLGTFDWVGPIRQQAELDLLQPYVLANRLTERVLAIAAYRKTYLDTIDHMTRTSFSPDFVRRQVTLFQDVITRAEMQANVPHRPLPPGLPAEIDPNVFVARRLDSVRAQLAGTREGYLPYWQKGFFGAGSPPARRAASTTRPVVTPATGK